MTQYGGVAGPEQEVTIRLDHETRQAHLCSTWPEWSRKLERLYGAPAKVSKSRDGRVTSAFWTVPLAVVNLRRVRAKRELTAEQRRHLADRLETARFSRQALRNSVT